MEFWGSTCRKWGNRASGTCYLPKQLGRMTPRAELWPQHGAMGAEAEAGRAKLYSHRAVLRPLTQRKPPCWASSSHGAVGLLISFHFPLSEWGCLSCLSHHCVHCVLEVQNVLSRFSSPQMERNFAPGWANTQSPIYT